MRRYIKSAQGSDSELPLPVDRNDRRLAFNLWARRVPQEPKRRRVGKCPDCGHRFWLRFATQAHCFPCRAERRRKARAKVQPNLPGMEP